MKSNSRSGFAAWVMVLLLVGTAGSVFVLHTVAQRESKTAQHMVQREAEPEAVRVSIPLWLPEGKDFAVLSRSCLSMIMIGHRKEEMPIVTLLLRHIPSGALVQQVQRVDRFGAEPSLTQAQKEAVSKGKRYYYVTEYKGSIRGYLWLGRVRILFMGQGKRSKLPITRLCEQYTVAYKASQKYLATLRPGSVEWYMVRSTCEVQEYPVPDDVRDGAK